METITVTGYAYGFNSRGEILYFRPGAFYRHLKVRSQYGWESGCRERDHRSLQNVVCISHIPGDAHNLGTAEFVPETFEGVTRRGNPCECWFETSTMTWSLKESVPGYDVPQRKNCIGAADIRHFVQ